MAEAEEIAEHEAWIAGLAPTVAAEARRLYPDPTVLPCVRSTTNPGHYLVVSFLSGDDRPVGVTLIHTADSYLPGVRVMEVPASELVPCGCGKAAMPTEVQTQATTDQLDARLSEAKAMAASVGLDWEALAPAERRAILWGQP